MTRKPSAGGSQRPAAMSASAYQARLRRDVRSAGWLARRAAARLEPMARDRRSAYLYRVAFGHSPYRPARARSADSGIFVARRFRKVAAVLERGGIEFLYRPQPGAHQFRNAAVPRVVADRRNRNVIWLYPRYWSHPPEVRAGILIHETLHLCCPVGDQGTAPRRIANAHCYEWLALVLDGYAAEPSDLHYCSVTRP